MGYVGLRYEQLRAYSRLNEYGRMNGFISYSQDSINVVGYENRDHIMQNAIFFCFSSCHHSKATGFPLGL